MTTLMTAWISSLLKIFKPKFCLALPIFFLFLLKFTLFPRLCLCLINLARNTYDQSYHHQSLSSQYNQQQQQQQQRTFSKSLPTKYSQYINESSSYQQQPSDQRSIVRTSTYLIPDHGNVPLTPVSTNKTSKSISHQVVPSTSRNRPFLGSNSSRSKSFEEQTEETRYHRAAPEYTVETSGGEETDEFDYTNESIKALAQRFGEVSSIQSPRRTKTSSFTLRPVESKDDLYTAFKPSKKYKSHYAYNVVQKATRKPNKSLIEFPEQEFLISKTSNKLELLGSNNQQPRSIDEGPSSYRKVTTTTMTTTTERQPGPELLKKLPPVIRRSEGQQVRFEIEIGANFPPHSIQVTWTRNGVTIENSTDTRISSTFGLHTLIIPEVFAEDSGLYRVLVSTPIGNLESFTQLVVEGCS